MIDRAKIREHMEVKDRNGDLLGRVDAIEGDRLKLTRRDSPDGQHHYVSMSDIDRVDTHIHLRTDRAAVFGAAAAGAGAAHAAGSAIPPLKNPAVDHAKPRRNYMLPWVLLGLAILGLILALSQCGRDGEEERAAAVARDQAAQQQANAVAPATIAPGAYQQGTLAYDVNQYIMSNARPERTFTFGNLNFDTGRADIRDVEQSDIAQLAEVLKANPAIRAAVVGYADARGSSAANATLGGRRANAVVRALQERGVNTANIEARTGGELNPTAANTTAQGQAENRRTEFIILARQ